MASNEIRVILDQEAVARAAATLREAGRQLSESLKFAQALAVEPWTIEAPYGGTLTAYVDEYNQERWVPVNQVPAAGLRRLYVDKRAPELKFGADAGTPAAHPDGCAWPSEACMGHVS